MFNLKILSVLFIAALYRTIRFYIINADKKKSVDKYKLEND